MVIGGILRTHELVLVVHSKASTRPTRHQTIAAAMRNILRQVQFGLMASAALLVVMAFQRLQLYSVPVLVGHIVHPGGHSDDYPYDESASGRQELVGHGHPQGKHRIFSTNVIEIGLFKFVVPFRWSTSMTDDVGEEAVKRTGRRDKWLGQKKMRRKKTEHSEDARRGRARESRGTIGHSDADGTGDRTSIEQTASEGLERPHVRPSEKAIPRETEHDEEGKNSTISTLVVAKLNTTSFNSTLVDSRDGNITALPGRRLLRT